MEGGSAKVPGINGSQNRGRCCIRGWDLQGRRFGEMLEVSLPSAQRWVAWEGCVRGGADLCKGRAWDCWAVHRKIEANNTNCAHAALPRGKEDARGETRVPANAHGPRSPPRDPMAAPLWCSAEGSGYSLSRQGSQTVWLTPQGCTTPSPRLQALQHSPLVVYILVKHLSLEPQAGPWERKQSQEVTLVMGPCLRGQAEKCIASRSGPALGWTSRVGAKGGSHIKYRSWEK